MKKIEAMIPLLDMTCLTVGVLLVAMTQMQKVVTIPVDFVKVAKEASVSKNIDTPLFIAISKDGIFVEKKQADLKQLKEVANNREVILRIDRAIPYGEVMKLVSEIKQVTKGINLEVQNE